MSIQKRLLSESELSFRKAVELAIAMETAAKDSVELREDPRSTGWLLSLGPLLLGRLVPRMK